jgi:hypothetical protein
LWLALAGLSLTYLTFLGVRPDLVAAWQSDEGDTETRIVETQRTVERALADLDPLKQTVGEVKMEVANVKVGLDEAAMRDRILLDKVEALERSTVEAQEKLAAAQQTKKAEAKTAAPKRKPAEIETGSIEEKKKAAAPAKPAPVGVLLATGPSLDAVRLSWTILNDRHKDAISSLHPRYVVSSGADGQTYGLVAGPLKTVADAKAVCKTMTDRGMPCEISVYRGNAF